MVDVAKKVAQDSILFGCWRLSLKLTAAYPRLLDTCTAHPSKASPGDLSLAADFDSRGAVQAPFGPDPTLNIAHA